MLERLTMTKDTTMTTSTFALPISLVREANMDRDGWPTSAWLRDLARHVEAIGYAMDVDDPMRNRVQSSAAALMSGSDARSAYPSGVSRSVDVERRRALDDATNTSDGVILILPTLTYDAARAAEYRRSRGW